MAVGADGKVYGYATNAAGLAHAVRWVPSASIATTAVFFSVLRSLAIGILSIDLMFNIK